MVRKSYLWQAVLPVIILILVSFRKVDGGADPGGLKLPKGFHSSIIATVGGGPRHIAVAPGGGIYVKLIKAIEGRGVLYLKPNSAGKTEVIRGFGNYGGTGICIENGYLYTSSNDDIFRYQLDGKDEVMQPEKPEKIVAGLINRREHNSKSIVVDDAGHIYVNIGAYSNSCQEEDRQPGAMGRKGCPILDSAGGIWQFRTDRLNQGYAQGVRYATGLRNVVGLDWNRELNQLFVMQHGRDQLHDLFPDLYTTKQNAQLPAECLYGLHQGDNCGWPYMYYDQLQHKKILAPEYGGDGKKTGGEGAIEPTVAFPGHLAPNGLLFYTGRMFPERYRNGAFIAFHGSWNRAPEPQAGYFVVFQPFKNGKPFGSWEVFADGFAGSAEKAATGRADHRPCGLAQGPDGALYVTDDAKGAIYKITYESPKP